jgi:hypothetical protein
MLLIWQSCLAATSIAYSFSNRPCASPSRPRAGVFEPGMGRQIIVNIIIQVIILFYLITWLIETENEKGLWMRWMCRSIHKNRCGRRHLPTLSALWDDLQLSQRTLFITRKNWAWKGQKNRRHRNVSEKHKHPKEETTHIEELRWGRLNQWSQKLQTEVSVALLIYLSRDESETREWLSKRKVKDSVRNLGRDPGAKIRLVDRENDVWLDDFLLWTNNTFIPYINPVDILEIIEEILIRTEWWPAGPVATTKREGTVNLNEEGLKGTKHVHVCK